jgi:hypothetical protein
MRYGLPLEIGETVQILEECAGEFQSTNEKLSFQKELWSRRDYGLSSINDRHTDHWVAV